MLIRDRIALHRTELTPQLRVAANFVTEHPTEVATHSLRNIAGRINVPPVTFTRLAKAVGFENYAQLRESCRNSLKQPSISFANRAKHLQQHRNEEDTPPLLYQHSAAIFENIESLTRTISIEQLQSIAEQLSRARNVYLLGALSSAPITQFWGYIARLAFDHWHVVNEGEGRFASVLTSLAQDDIVIVISKAPHARWSIIAAQEAQQTGAKLVVLSNTISCPAVRHADFHFAIPDESPQFFSSYASLLVLIESLMGMVVSRSGEQTAQHIEAIENNNFRLGKYWNE